MKKPPVLSEDEKIKDRIFALVAWGRESGKIAEPSDRIFGIVQQARQDTAREILGKLIREGADKTFAGEEWWSELKSKFLIPPNPVGSADV